MNEIDLLKICEKLSVTKNCTVQQETFYYFMWSGMNEGTVFPFITYEDDKMTGCIVFSLDKDLKDTVLSLIFVWIDPKNQELWEEYVEFAREIAIEKGANKIQVNTSRNPKAILRKLGKFGFAQKYVIFEKDVI